MVEIFISYSRDDRQRAQRLAELLVRRGYSVWWDVNLLPGTDFSTEIASVIHGAKAAIVLWSSSSIVSLFVRDEAALASRLGILIPILIEPVQPPLGFGSYHCADLSHWTGDPAAAALEPVFQAIITKVPLPSGVAVTSPAAVETALDTFKDEAAFWVSISAVPSQRVEEYEAYLARFGDKAVFADLARSRIATLTAESLNPPQPRPAPNLAHLGDRANVWLSIAAALVTIIAGLAGFYFWRWPNKAPVIFDPPAGNAQDAPPKIADPGGTPPPGNDSGTLDPKSVETQTPQPAQINNTGIPEKSGSLPADPVKVAIVEPVACDPFEDGVGVVTKSCLSPGAGTWNVVVKKTPADTSSPNYMITGSVDGARCGTAKLGATSDDDSFSCVTTAIGNGHLELVIRPSDVAGFDAYHVPMSIRVTRTR